MPVHDSELGRLYMEGGRPLPYVRDIIDKGSEGMRFDDIIVFTNSDTCMSTNCVKKIRSRMKKVDACYSYRRDFAEFLDVIPDGDIKNGKDGFGSDLHAFKYSWWRKNRLSFPPMVFARIGWDAVMRHLIDESGKWPETKVENIIYHQSHEAFWEKPENKFKLPGNGLNIFLVNEFLKKRGIAPEKFRI